MGPKHHLASSLRSVRRDMTRGKQLSFWGALLGWGWALLLFALAMGDEAYWVVVRQGASLCSFAPRAL